MDELQISGKRFISARRIARENGYTSDYIGQLIRGGKIVGQKVGRAWYVDAASFDRYIGSEQPAAEETPVVVAEAQAVEPAPIVEETESRADSLEALVEETAPMATEEVVEEQPITVETVVEEAVEVEAEKEKEVFADVAEETQPTRITLHVAKKQDAEERVGGLRYYADDTPAVPEIALSHNASRLAQEAEAETVSEKIETPVFKTSRSKLPMRIALASVGLVILFFSALVSSALSLNLTVQEGNTATATYSFEW